ncbi:hypothetical protein [Spirosoma arcticum]
MTPLLGAVSSGVTLVTNATVVRQSDGSARWFGTPAQYNQINA